MPAVFVKKERLIFEGMVYSLSILRFSPSSSCEACLALMTRSKMTNFTSAGSSNRSRWLEPPQVRAYSFIRSLAHLHNSSCWFRALQRCEYFPLLLCLLCIFYSSVPDSVVPLSSGHGSPHTPFRLPNRLHKLACMEHPPFGII